MNPLPALALLALVPSMVVAQMAPIRPAPSRLFAAGTVPVASNDTAAPLADHRVTGAVIGGVLGGAVGYLLGEAMRGGGACPASGGCGGDGDHTELVGAVSVGLLGAGLGYLAGRSTPKGSLPDVPPLQPLPKGTGLTPAQGAGIGALIGGLAFAYFASTDNSGDGVPPVAGISLGVLIGAFVGGGLARE